MIVYRLSREKHMHDLSGRGAEIAGGRWNSPGMPMLYCSSSKALCLVEVLVHIQADGIPTDYFIVEIEIPDDAKILSQYTAGLEENWKNFPWINSTQKIGDTFLEENKALALKVPSAIVEDEFNFLVNPMHRDFSKIKILRYTLFNFDSRLFVHRH